MRSAVASAPVACAIAAAISVTYAAVPAPLVVAISRGLVTSARASTLNASGAPDAVEDAAALGGQRDLAGALPGRAGLQRAGLRALHDDELGGGHHQRDDEHELPHPQAAARVRRARRGPAARRAGTGSRGRAAGGAGRAGAGRGRGHQPVPVLVRVARPGGGGAVRGAGRGVPRSRRRSVPGAVSAAARGRRRCPRVAVVRGRRRTGRRLARVPVAPSVRGRRRTGRRPARCRSPARSRSRAPWPSLSCRGARPRVGSLVPPVASGPSPPPRPASPPRRPRGLLGHRPHRRDRRRRTAWGAAAKAGADGAAGGGARRRRGRRAGRRRPAARPPASGSPTTVVVPSAATTSRAGSLAGTMPSCAARWASAGGDCRAATSRCSRSLRSLRSRAALAGVLQPVRVGRRRRRQPQRRDEPDPEQRPSPSARTGRGPGDRPCHRPGAGRARWRRAAGAPPRRRAPTAGARRPRRYGAAAGRSAAGRGRSMTGALIASLAALGWRCAQRCDIDSLARSLMCPPRLDVLDDRRCSTTRCSRCGLPDPFGGAQPHRGGPRVVGDLLVARAISAPRVSSRSSGPCPGSSTGRSTGVRDRRPRRQLALDDPVLERLVGQHDDPSARRRARRSRPAAPPRAPPARR